MPCPGPPSNAHQRPVGPHHWEDGRQETREAEGADQTCDGAQANDLSFSSAISADGRFVAFTSFASNLLPGDTNGGGDVFVRVPVD